MAGSGGPAARRRGRIERIGAQRGEEKDRERHDRRGLLAQERHLRREEREERWRVAEAAALLEEEARAQREESRGDVEAPRDPREHFHARREEEEDRGAGDAPGERARVGLLTGGIRA